MALSDGSQFLYSLDSASDTISVFQIEAGGALSLIQTVVGLSAFNVALLFSFRMTEISPSTVPG